MNWLTDFIGQRERSKEAVRRRQVKKGPLTTEVIAQGGPRTKAFGVVQVSAKEGWQ